MNTLFKQSLAIGVLSAMFAGTTMAAPTETPPAFVKRVADNLIVRLKKDHNKLQNNPAAIRSVVEDELLEHIDSAAFARNVLGQYARQSTPAQRKQFETNLRETLIKNYGSAFAKFTNQTYKMRPYKTPANPKLPEVTIDFINKTDRIPVTFQLTESGNTWKIRNLQVSGVEIGLQFRNQFANTVKRNGNDLDKAIANFKPDVEKAVEKK